MRPRAPALLLVLASCGWIQRHPAVTLTTVVGGVISFGTCEIGDGRSSTCAIFGASGALFLGGLTALAVALLDTGDHALATPPNGQELTNGGAIRIHTRTLPPPVPLDAGSGGSDGETVPDDAAMIVDAGVITDASAM
jgi:hypothetical protein